MAKYLRKFETEAEYSAATLNYPSVAWVTSTDVVHFDKENPTPPVFEGKYRLTLNDGSTVSAECDSSSEITSDEISAYASTTVSAEIGNCVTSTDRDAFYNFTSLESIDIPSSVTSFGVCTFQNCTSLESIDIPSSVTSFGEYAFLNCSGLISIKVESTNPPVLGSGVFDGTVCAIYVPSESVEAYKAASGWSTYADRIQAIS